MAAPGLPQKGILSRLADYTPPEADARVRSSLRRLLLEGTPADVALRTKDSFATAFALTLKATPFQIGFLTAMAFLAGAVAQLLTDRLVQAIGSRKKAILLLVFLSALVWVPVALLPWMFDTARVWWLIGFVSLGLALIQMPTPAWGSWMAALLPVNRRGRFLGARATLATLVGVLTVLGLGRVMDLTHNRAFLGFTIVFFGIVFCRFISLLLLWRVHDPPLPKHVAKGPGFREMMRSMMKSDLGRFMFLNFFFNLACTVGGPFFTVLILKDLQFSYTTFILLQMVSACSAMIGLQVWGRIADRAGNARILHIVVPVIGIVAISWVFHQSVLYLAFVHMAGGFVWAGYNVSSLNYALETSSDEERTKLVGYYAAFAGVGIFIGSLTGGIIAPYVPKIFAYSTLTLIFISGLLRLGTGIAMLVMVREVRKLEPSVHPRGLMHLPSSLLHLGRRQE